MAEQPEHTEPSRAEVWKMFDRIAPRYDLGNRLLSMRRDVAWRKRMSRYLPPGENLEILDIATGTGDQLISLDRESGRVAKGTGIDMAEEMLAIGRRKIDDLGCNDRLSLATGDAMNIPFPEQQFDAATISFGIRNVMDVEGALREMARVLKPGGRALILEFSTPENPVFRPLYLFYLRHVLPHIGGMVTGDAEAYRYLNQTIETFPYGKAFCDKMERNGFASAEAHPLTLGIATIYQGDVPR